MRELLQPEAFFFFFFFGEDGQGTFFVVFDLADPSQLPVVSEPLYQLGKANVTMTPCMNVEDLKKGVEEAGRRMQDMQG